VEWLAVGMRNFLSRPCPLFWMFRSWEMVCKQSVNCEQLSCLIRSCPVSKEMAVNYEEEQGIQSVQSIGSHIGSVSWACMEQHHLPCGPGL